METVFRLLTQRRFLPLFITQFLGAFNDNLFKMAMIVLVTFTIYSDPKQEAWFSALAGGIFILPFFLLSAASGQLADLTCKARIARLVKTAEIVIMIVGAAGLLLHSIPLMLAALFAMGIHSTFFGPIKYAILPQHLDEDHVLGGTALVEAGTYVAILLGTIAGGWLPYQWSAIGVIGVAIVGRIASIYIPDAPPVRGHEAERTDWHVFRASWRMVRDTLHVPRVFMAIMAISFFWAIGAIFAAQFPPMVKNALGADNTVATIFTAVFSVGVAIGSVAVNRLLSGHVSARYSPASVIVMGLFVLDLWWTISHWSYRTDTLMGWDQFIALGSAERIMFDLLGIAIAGGMFVVPLYAFLTTTVDAADTAKAVAANNIVNSGAMVIAALLLSVLTGMGVTIEDTILLVAVACIVSAWIAHRLVRIEGVPH